MNKFAGYLKFAGVVTFINYIVGIVIFISKLSKASNVEAGLLFFQFLYYIVTGPAISILLVAVAYLLEVRIEDMQNLVTKDMLVEKRKKTFINSEWSCDCGHENKANYKVCINCGKPRTR